MLKIVIIVAIAIVFAPIIGTSFATDYKTSPFFGKDAGDGMTTYNIQYSSVKEIVSPSVSTKDKSISFELVGKTDANSTLVLKLPTGLIGGPFIGVIEDGQIISNFTTINETGDTIISIPINPLTESISIVGTTVVPEFGSISAIVLVAGIVVIVTITRFRPINF